MGTRDLYSRNNLNVRGKHSVLSSAASIYLEVDPKEKFEEEFKNIEVSIRDMRVWINKTKDDIALLPRDPSSFDEIWATIDPDRTKQLKEQVILIEKLVEKSNAL